jgi:hypothetical protein
MPPDAFPDPERAPEEYLDEPTTKGLQDDEPEPQARVLTLFRQQPLSPRTWEQALAWSASESASRSQNWAGLCQKFCRSTYGIGGGFGSAIAQWHGMPDSARHVGGSPADAPVGSTLFSRSHDPSSSSFTFGHIILAARPFSDGTPGAWSTDAVRVGWPDKVSRAGLYARWDHEYLGWGTNMNGVELQYKEAPPLEDKPYEAIATAIERLGNALDNLRTARNTAKEQEDWADVKALNSEIDTLIAEKRRLKHLYDTLRRS